MSYFDGPPVISCAVFGMHEGLLTEAVNAFVHPFWDKVRDSVAGKALDMRRQDFFGGAMLPMAELEYPASCKNSNHTKHALLCAAIKPVYTRGSVPAVRSPNPSPNSGFLWNASRSGCTA